MTATITYTGVLTDPYKEEAGDRYPAGQTRYNAVLTLADADWFDDALLYARAALRDFESYGPSATQDIADTRRLID